MKVIDISEHQGNIDFTKVKKEVDGVILRCGYGRGNADKKFETYVKACKQNNIPIVAIYHFSYALNTEEAKNEAKYAVSVCNKHNLKDVIIFFDLEYDSVDYAKKMNVVIDTRKCIDFTKAFCEEVKKSGYKTGIYFNADYYNGYYDRFKWVTPESEYFFWLADWTKFPNNVLVDMSILHQYSATGKVSGISGNVDMNNYYPEKFKMETKTETPAPAPQKPVEKKSTEVIVSEILEGKWGNGDDRKKKLTDAGYDYKIIQGAVNEKLNVKASPTAPPKAFNEEFKGKYKVTASALNCRYIPGVLTQNNIYKLIYNGTIVSCDGYYTNVAGDNWLLIKVDNTECYVCGKYVVKV